MLSRSNMCTTSGAAFSACRTPRSRCEVRTCLPALGGGPCSDPPRTSVRAPPLTGRLQSPCCCRTCGAGRCRSGLVSAARCSTRSKAVLALQQVEVIFDCISEGATQIMYVEDRSCVHSLHGDLKTCMRSPRGLQLASPMPDRGAMELPAHMPDPHLLPSRPLTGPGQPGY